jgi:phytoene dehydrogenase-like protein
MRQLPRGIVAPAVACLALVAFACNKGPAESALASADRELAAVRVDLERYAPDQLASLNDVLTKARAALAEGHYTDALRTAQKLPERIRSAAEAAGAKKQRLTGTWDELSPALAASLQAITDRVTALAGATSLPRGLTPDAFAAARAELDAVTREWNEATTAFQGGDVPKALQLAGDVKARAEALAGTLGLAPPAAAPAAAPPPR